MVARQRFNRLSKVFSAAVVGLAGLASLMVASPVSAASVPSCSWIGADTTSDYLWSRPGNWTCTSGTVPANGYDVIYNYALFTGLTQLVSQNDIPNLKLHQIVFENSDSFGFPVNVKGDSVELTDGVIASDAAASSGPDSLELSITLAGDQTFSLNQPTGSKGLSIGDLGGTDLNLNGHSLTLSSANGQNLVINSAIVGSGTVQTDATQSGGLYTLNGDSPDFSGALAINAGEVEIGGNPATTKLGTAKIDIASGGNLYIALANQAVNIKNDIKMSGSGQSGQDNGAITLQYFGQGSSNVQLSGNITLNGNTQLELVQANTDITGAVTGCNNAISKTTSSDTSTLTGNLTGSCDTGGSSSSNVPGTPDTGYGVSTSNNPLVATILIIAATISAGAGLALFYRQRKIAE